MRRFIVAVVFLGSLTFAQEGFISSYHPYPSAKKIALRNCINNATGFVCPHGRVLVRRTAQGEQIVNLDLFGRRYPIRFATMPSFVSSVWQADLNLDRKADMIIKLNWGGNGIIADGNLTVFALSSTSGYKLTTINTITFDPNALIYLRGKPTILHTALVGVTFPSSKKFAERNHNYWVFHPLEIRGARLSKNQAATWVQYTYIPSHRAARLTKTQKSTALRLEPIQFFETMK